MDAHAGDQKRAREQGEVSVPSPISMMGVKLPPLGMVARPAAGVRQLLHCIAIAASSSTSEEAPAAARLTHRSLEECVQQATEETSTEVSWQR